MEDQNTSAKNTARVNLTLTKRPVDALEPENKPWIAWDGKLTGFGVRVHPARAKAFVVDPAAATAGAGAQQARGGRAGQPGPDKAAGSGSSGARETGRRWSCR